MRRDFGKGGRPSLAMATPAQNVAGRVGAQGIAKDPDNGRIVS